MRVLISAPPKSGGSQLRCLIAAAYGLRALNTREAPGGSDHDALYVWLTELPDASVASLDLPWSEALAHGLGEDVRLVSIIRHPFDLFLASYDVAQQRAARGRQAARGWGALAGKPIDDPAIINFACRGFAAEVTSLRGWSESSAATIRFETLEADPAEALRIASERLGALDGRALTSAVELCPADQVIVSRPSQGRRMGNVPAGSWRERLPAVLLDVLRERYAEDAVRLGYDV